MENIIVTDESAQTEALETTRTNEEIVEAVKRWEAASNKRWGPIKRQIMADDRIGFKGDMNYDEYKKSWQSMISMPAGFRTIQSMLGAIKRYMPGTDITPDRWNDNEFAEQMQTRFNYEVEKAKLKRTYLDAVEYALRMKMAPVKYEWVDEPGYKGVRGEVLNPYAVLFPENAVSVETSSYIIILYPKTLSDIKREKGVMATADAIITENGMFAPFDGKNGKQDTGHGTVHNAYPTGHADYGEKGQETAIDVTASENDLTGQYAFVKEVWYTDPETGDEMMVEIINDQVTSKDPATGTVGPILNTAFSPSGFGRKPIFLMKNYGSIHELMGTSESEITNSIDIGSNEVMNSILDWVKKAANPPRYALRSFLTSALGKFLGKDREQIIVNRPDEVGFLQLPPQPTIAMNMFQALKEEHQDASGVYNETIGKASTGVTSGVAIAELKEAGETVIQFKVEEEISNFIEDVSKFVVWLILKFDSESLELSMGEGDEKRRVTWSPDEFREAVGFTLEGGSQWTDTPFNIKVRAGQQQPHTRSELISRAERLFAMGNTNGYGGVYGVEEIVRDLGLPDGKRTVQRFYERKGWSPETIEQLIVQVGNAIVDNPEDQVALAKMEVLNEIFPSITEAVMKKIEN